MQKVSIRISDGEQELHYLVSPEVAGKLVQHLNQVVFPSTMLPPQNFDFTPVSRKYRGLAKYLHEQDAAAIALTFSQIEDILEEPLKPSARKHAAWWANTDSHSQATAWLAVGWKTSELDLAAETLIFQKSK
ncbi:hypothetical protein ACI3L1_03460 [Deinococcus sp. SM5_A1]|uniref:DUF7662 domain-containing protein n=1 Tax=Deinococcus sp. SM5_A1 TaxID=3379094 RepID=UPI00385CD67F